MSEIKSIVSLLSFLLQAIVSILIIWLSNHLIDPNYTSYIVYTLAIGGLFTLADFGLKTIYQRVYAVDKNDAKGLLNIFVLLLLIYSFIGLILEYLFEVNSMNVISFIFRTFFYFRMIEYLSNGRIIKEKIFRIIAVILNILLFYATLKTSYYSHALFFGNLVYFFLSIRIPKEKIHFRILKQIFFKYFDSIRDYMKNLVPAYFLIPLPLLLIKGFVDDSNYISLGYLYQILQGATAFSTIPTIALVSSYAKLPFGDSYINLIRLNQSVSIRLFVYSFIGGIILFSNYIDGFSSPFIWIILIGVFGILESYQKVWMYSKIQKGIMGYPKVFILSVLLQLFLLYLLREMYPSLVIVLAILVQMFIVDIYLINREGFKHSSVLFYPLLFLLVLGINNSIVEVMILILVMFLCFLDLKKFYENLNNYPGQSS